jgi:hypothetical protein
VLKKTWVVFGPAVKVISNSKSRCVSHAFSPLSVNRLPHGPPKVYGIM